MSHTISTNFAFANVKCPPPKVIWKKPVDDQLLYVSGCKRKLPSGWQAVSSEPTICSAAKVIRLPRRPKNQITPKDQPSPRSHRVALRSRPNSLKAVREILETLRKVMSAKLSRNGIAGKRAFGWTKNVRYLSKKSDSYSNSGRTYRRGNAETSGSRC
jgi:hypothetical protein